MFHCRLNNDGEAEWLTTDFFDTDADGKIVEHWDVIAPVKPANPSARTQIDGPTKIVDVDKTAAKKELVVEFINNCLICRHIARISDFFNSDKYR